MPPNLRPATIGQADDYTNDALSMPERDLDQFSPINEQTFAASANIIDGHAGRKPIDSSFENFSDPEVNMPRSRIPAVVDAEVRGTAGTNQMNLEKYPHRRN